MRSMTGFGQATGANRRHAITVTLRGVNHRFLEIRVHLGDEYYDSEAAARELLAGELQRGRVEMGVEIRSLEPRPVEVEVHRPVVQAVHAALEELVSGGLIAERLSAGDLLRLPEALTLRQQPDTWDDDDLALLLEVTGRALAEMMAAREAEGEKTRSALADRLGKLDAVAARLRAMRGRVRGELHASLASRVAELMDGRRLDDDRLAQEVAILVDRSDVAEELERLEAHLGHFRDLLAAAGAVGKRLDFLSQEILRELNTLGAKCRDGEMTRAVLDGKVLCEQLREQVQNAE